MNELPTFGAVNAGKGTEFVLLDEHPETTIKQTKDAIRSENVDFITVMEIVNVCKDTRKISLKLKQSKLKVGYINPINSPKR